MVSYQNYLTFSVLVALLYSAAGVVWLGVHPEITLVAGVIIVVTGLLPEIDSDNAPPSREVGGFLAAISPILLIEMFPRIQAGGVARIALVVIASYLVTRIIIVRLLQKHTTQMGMVHSIPAAIITFELVYLMFWDLYTWDRLFVATAAFTGYFAHLLLDAGGNLDLFGKAQGNAERANSALKVAASSSGANIAIYGVVLYLGWFVIIDFYPNLSFNPGIQY